jgi:Ca2+-binding EF-hand superfamily protein
VRLNQPSYHPNNSPHVCCFHLPLIFAVCFSIYDGDRNGFITKEEIQKLAWSKAKAEGKGNQEQKDLIVDTVNKIFAYVDKNKDGMLSKAELITAVTKYPELKNVL